MSNVPKCNRCSLNEIVHTRKQLCSLCYKSLRKEQWRKLDQLRQRNSQFVERRKQYKASYFQLNKDRLSALNAEYERKRLKNDINFFLRKTLRRRLSEAIKNNTKTGSAINDLGCTMDKLKTYLESKFQPGMTWDNYGKWHIDHIIPLSSFNLSNREEFLKACHYTNLQPLWAKDNLKKGSRFYEPV